MSEQIRQMFAKIAGKYDFLNSILSFGLHHNWRKKTVKKSGIISGMSVLDCATGTGDLAIKFKNASGEKGSITGTDFCDEMLSIARRKIKRRHIDIEFKIADVLNLPYESNIFDISSIAFGIRNVDAPLKCLLEMSRVVKPGGKVVVLEFGQPFGFFSILYKFYSKRIIPFFGILFSKDRSAYKYLPETAARFPCKEDFINLMIQTGKLKDCTYYSLTFGIAFIYIGTVCSEKN